MKTKNCVKESFVVIGKEGSTMDGQNFIQKLWEDANSHFNEVQDLAKKDENGTLCGIWGAMSDLSRTFQPWTDGFTKGLYLAGVECRDDAEAPEGWTKWVIPSFEYICAECETPDTFTKMISYLNEQQIPLAGAVQDHTEPATGKQYMYFPIRKR